MKAMILAGGMSTRLYPLTRRVPKPLVPVAGEPNVVHVLRSLRAHGYDEVAMNVHYLSEMIRDRLGDGSDYGVKLHYLDEHELSGSAGAVKAMEGFFTETFVVVGCDGLTNFDLTALVQQHKDRNALATIGLIEGDEVDQYGVVVLDDNRRIVEFQEKPARGTERSKLVNTGIYCFDPGIFDRIPERTFYDFGKQVFPELQRDHAAFYGVADHRAYWTDIGTIPEYRRASRDVMTGRFEIDGLPPHEIARDATIAAEAELGDDVRIGRNSVVAAGARIINGSVVGAGVYVGARAVLDGSIIWDGAVVGAGARLNDTIVGFRTEIPSGGEFNGDVIADESALASS